MREDKQAFAKNLWVWLDYFFKPTAYRYFFDALFITSDETSLFCGDLRHGAIQIGEPEWDRMFCGNDELAVQSRRWLPGFAAEKQSMLFTSHLHHPSLKRFTAEEKEFKWISTINHQASRQVIIRRHSRIIMEISA